MKILVLGASGMAGHVISQYFINQNHIVHTFSNNDMDFKNHIVGDALDFENLKKIVVEGKYDAIINAIGILNEVADENKPLAIMLNSYLPHFLVEITKDTKTKVIQMSTDCVFSGKDGNYKEDSIKDGLSFYDRTKALGEIDNSKDLTFRNSIIGPDRNPNGIGLFNWFMKQEGKINGYTKSIWTGVTTITLARAMEKAIQQNLTGIYNLVNNTKINKHDLLVLFNEEIKKDKIDINPVEGTRLDKSLISTRSDFDFTVPSYKEMVIEMKEWIAKNHHFYPYYKIGDK